MASKQSAWTITISLCFFIALRISCLLTATSAQDSREALHQKVLDGERIIFNLAEPEGTRTIDAVWIREAALKHAQIHISGAVIRGPLKLHDVTFDEEFELATCTIEDYADFSYAVFKRRFMADQAKFRKGVTFGNATFNYGSYFSRTEFGGGIADFEDLHALDAFAITQARFATGTIAAFHFARFARRAIFNLTVFGGNVFFDNAQFAEEADFEGVRFEGYASFIRARLASDALFNGAVFERKAIFPEVHIGGDVVFARMNPEIPALGKPLPAAVFHDESDFSWAEIEGLADFDTVIFGKKATFTGAKIGRVAAFNRVHFGADVDFTLAIIGGDALFPATFFRGKAIFNRSEIKGSARFGSESTQSPERVRFDGDVDFSLVHFGGDAKFDRAEFKNVLRFEHAAVGGRTTFTGARFLPGSEPSFRGTVFNQEAWFQGADFGKGASFQSAQFASEARFSGVRFSDSADFTGARFVGLAYFDGEEEPNASTKLPGTSFQEVRFDDARFAGDAYFRDSIFNKRASFRETTFRSVYLSTAGLVGTSQQFLGDIDMRGCTYDRIETSWSTLLRYPDGRSRLNPYDRQPFIELEGFLRKVGSDDQANAVYLERRRVEHDSLKSWSSDRLWDDVYWLAANFGNDLWHEFLIALGLVGLGSLILSRFGAALPRDSEFATETKISPWEALWVSVHEFLPFGLPVKPRWMPSRRRVFPPGVPLLTAATYANILRIFGWILIPLGVAALTGVLRHVAP